jgi:hypothetical protein
MRTISDLRRIDTREDLAQVARMLGVRMDWHEPDEQEVTARVYGDTFDNAGFWPATDPHRTGTEQYVVLYQDSEPVAAVNLATLLAWATGYESEPQVGRTDRVVYSRDALEDS